MTEIASGLLSIKIQSRPSSLQTEPVVPLPAKKSRTESPGLEDTEMIRRRMNSGFWLGYPVFSLPLVGTIVCHHVSVGVLPIAIFSGPAIRDM